MSGALINPWTTGHPERSTGPVSEKSGGGETLNKCRWPEWSPFWGPLHGSTEAILPEQPRSLSSALLGPAGYRTRRIFSRGMRAIGLRPSRTDTDGRGARLVRFHVLAG